MIAFSAGSSQCPELGGGESLPDLLAAGGAFESVESVDSPGGESFVAELTPVVAAAFDFAFDFTFDAVLRTVLLEVPSPSALASLMAAELMQKRRPVGGGPSSKTCPRCAPQRRHITSIRGSPSL